MATTTTTVPLVTVPVGALVRIDYPRRVVNTTSYDNGVRTTETVVLAEPHSVIGFRTETQTGMAMLDNLGITIDVVYTRGETERIVNNGRHNAPRYAPVTIICDCEPMGPGSRCECLHD